MNLNRQVLRATQNRLPLQDVSTQRYLASEANNRSKITMGTAVVQQENRPLAAIEKKVVGKPRPILTAVRSLKHSSQDNENDTAMLVSPYVKVSSTSPQPVPETETPREPAEDDLYEL